MEVDPKFSKIVREHLRFIGPTEPINPDKPLADYGLDSAGAIDLLMAIENAYGITMPDEFLTEEVFSTLASLWRTSAGLFGAGFPAQEAS